MAVPGVTVGGMIGILASPVPVANPSPMAGLITGYATRARWPLDHRGPSGSPHRRGSRMTAEIGSDADLPRDRRARSAGDQADPVCRRHASHRRRHRDRAVLPRLPLRRLTVVGGRQRSVRAIGRCSTTATSRRSWSPADVILFHHQGGRVRPGHHHRAHLLHFFAWWTEGSASHRAGRSAPVSSHVTFRHVAVPAVLGPELRD